ncbi:MAG: EcoKI restriction-modification system protein HsdS [Prosthecobacter sp.]|nr:EcoKI restriction-modification system protein HsdS [Prosthecobacter sp.]
MKRGWKETLVGEILQLEYGKPLEQSDRKPDGHYPVYGANGEKDRTDKVYHAKQSIIVGRKGSAGEINLTEKKFWPLDVTFFVTFDEKQHDLQFLYYLLTTLELTKLAKGVKPGINRNEVYSQTTRVPPLAEQQRIVGLLDEAFEGLATAKSNTEKKIRNARGLFESHLQSIFTQRGPGWVEKPLADLCDIKHGFAFKGEFFTNKGDYVVLTPGNYYESGGYRDRGEKQKYYAGEIPPYYIMKEGDMLVAMTEQAAGLLGSPLLVPESDKFLHNQRLGLVISKPGVPWINEFFFHVFNTQAVRKAIHDGASGVKVRHTSPTKIGEVIVTFPTSLKEQEAIVAILADLNEETQRLARICEQKLVALEALKKSLLHQAFSGQLTARAVKIVSPSMPMSVTVTSFVPTLTVLPDISFLDLHAAIVAMGYQHHQEQGNPSYGRTKAEKCGHGVEAWVGIELGRRPMKEAAGPADADRLWEVTNHAREKGYFSFEKPEGAARYRLTKGPDFDDLIVKAERALGERKAEVDQVLALMASMNREDASLFATVHAAWNNLLLDGETVTDERIVTEARENWHSKKMHIDRKCFFKALAWIREKKIIPMGKGKKVVAKSS